LRWSNSVLAAGRRAFVLSASEHKSIVDRLERNVTEVLRKKDSVLISVVGKNGSGKSYFGRYVRKHGLGRYGRRLVTVIDDGTMYFDSLYFFKRKISIPTTGVDELRPFRERMGAEKKIILYITATPARRITEADILLNFVTDEDTRRKRLERRYGEGSEKLKKYFSREGLTDFQIRYTYRIDAGT
jgi:hypothetical protein